MSDFDREVSYVLQNTMFYNWRRWQYARDDWAALENDQKAWEALTVHYRYSYLLQRGLLLRESARKRGKHYDFTFEAGR